MGRGDGMLFHAREGSTLGALDFSILQSKFEFDLQGLN